MAGTINVANISVGFDATKLKAGADLSRQEINFIKRSVQDSVSPMERYKAELEAIEKAYKAGAINGDRYNAMIERSARNHGIETEAAKRAREEEERRIKTERDHDAQLRRFHVLRQQVMTGEERHAQLVREYTRDLKQGVVTQEVYNRLVSQSAASNLTQKPVATLGMSSMMAFSASTAAAASSMMLAKNSLSSFIETANQIDEATDKATALGMTYSDLMITQRAFGDSTTMSSDEIASAMQKMQLNLFEARQGTSDLAKSLNMIGADPDSLLKGGSIEAIKTLSDEIKKMQNPTEQMKFAFDLFGRGGVSMVNALRAGRDPIVEMEKHLRNSGNLIDDIQANSIGNMNDALAKANDHVNGFWSQLTGNLSPAVTAIADLFTKIADKTIQPTTSSAMLPVAESIRQGTTYLNLYTLLSNSVYPTIVSLGKAQLEIDKAGADAAKNKRDAAILQSVEEHKKKEELEKQQNLQDSIQRSFDSQKESLTSQLEKMQLGESVASRQAAIRKGMTEQQAKELEKLQQAIELERTRTEEAKKQAAEKKRQADENMRSIISDAEALEKSLMTPQEMYANEIEKLQKMIDSGAINQAQFDQGRNAASRRAAEAMQRSMGGQPTLDTIAPTLRAGSVEAYKFAIKQAEDMSKNKDVEMLQKQIEQLEIDKEQLAIQKEALTTSKEMVESLKDVPAFVKAR